MMDLKDFVIMIMKALQHHFLLGITYIYHNLEYYIELNIFYFSLAAAASFDEDVLYAWGNAMGEEFWVKGANV